MTPERKGLHPRSLVIAIGLFLVALVTWRDAAGMQIRSQYGMGADAASYFVSVILVLLGLAHLIAALRPAVAPPEAEHADWTAIAWIGLALAALIGAIWLKLGFIIGSTLLFALTARAFGRRALLVDLLIGLVIATLIFLMFNKLLQLALPMGPLERLL